MTHELDSVVEAAEDIVKRWESPDWVRDAEHTGVKIRRLDKALTALQEYIERDGWKSIESAPKDERVQLYLSEFDVQHIAKWVQHPETGHESWLIVSGFDDEGNQVLCENPTHWRPLPTPPKGEES